MYKWSIKFILKNGVNLDCIYEGPEDNSYDVADKLISGKSPCEILGINSKYNGHHMFIMSGEIAAFDISLP